ncbi:MAG: tetratricopeptide repeat protein [Bacteroidaceae bacterium]|nr:tetratricopeptide repeat protein [Bacteroidaceae bacterium]
MHKLRYLLFVCAAFSFLGVTAQKSYREHLRSGNRLYADSLYDKAEVEYRKALELDPNGSQALFNLGNALLYQDKAQEAMDQYVMAEKRENEKGNLAQIHHNMGVICQASKDYARAVEYYKQALRENSTDHETRYNLALAMKQLKEQQQQQQEQQQNEEQQEQKEQEQEQQQQQNQEQQEQEQQQQQEQQEQQAQEEEENMSKENAEQLLESAMQDEKDVQEKVKKMMQIKGRKLDKDW